MPRLPAQPLQEQLEALAAENARLQAALAPEAAGVDATFALMPAACKMLLDEGIDWAASHGVLVRDGGVPPSPPSLPFPGRAVQTLP